MSAEFLIDVEIERHLVRITMSGFFTPADVDAFLEARASVHRKLTCPPNGHVTLYDVRGMKIQSTETVERFREMLAAPGYRSRRLAFIAPPTLARMQLERAITGQCAQCFEDPVVAEAWLFAKDGSEEQASRAAA